MPRSSSRSPSRGIFCDTDSDSNAAVRITTKRSKGSRQYRKKGQPSASVLTLDATVVAKLDLEVERKLQEAVKTDEVTRRIQERLVKERSRLEAELETKIAEERRLQLLRKRREQEQRIKEQADLEKILQENQMKLDAAKAQTDSLDDKPNYIADKMHSLNSRVTELNGAQLAEDVVVLGGGLRR